MIVIGKLVAQKPVSLNWRTAAWTWKFSELFKNNHGIIAEVFGIADHRVVPTLRPLAELTGGGYRLWWPKWTWPVTLGQENLTVFEPKPGKEGPGAQCGSISFRLCSFELQADWIIETHIRVLDRVVPTLRPLAELTGGGYRLWWPKWTWPVTLGQENLTVFEPKPGKEGPGAQCGSISFRLCSFELQADWIIETHIRVLDRVVPTLRPLAELTGGGYRLWWPKWTWPVTLGQENLTVFEPKPGKEGPGAQCGSISFRLCSFELQADWIIETHIRVLDRVVPTLRPLAELTGGGYRLWWPKWTWPVTLGQENLTVFEPKPGKEGPGAQCGSISFRLCSFELQADWIIETHIRVLDRVVPTLRPLAELTGGGYRLWWPKWTWPVTLGQGNLTVFKPKPGKEGPGAQCASISFRLCSFNFKPNWPL